MAAVLRLLEPRWLGLRNAWLRASPGRRATIVFFALAALAFWTGLLLLADWLVGSFHDVEVFGPILTRKLLELLLAGLFVLLCFSNLVTALSAFYLSDDLELLLSLPVPRPALHYARLAESVAQSSWMAAYFGIPVFVAYARAYGAGPAYAGALAAVAVGLVLVPAGIGLAAASLLVALFPARRLREVLVVGGVLALVTLVLLLRAWRPERLADAESFESVAAYVAQLQDPVPLLAPPRWMSDVLVAALTDAPMPWLEVGLLLTGGVAATGLARWITSALYERGRSRAQEVPVARRPRTGWLDRALAPLLAPLPRQAAAIALKDVKVFVRDPAQWSQVFLVGSIVGVTLASVAALPLDVVRGPWAQTWRNVFAFGSHALVGFIMAALAARFQFTAVSAEGRAFWLVRSAPITASRFLWSKAWPTLPPMIVVGQLLAVGSAMLLHAGPWVLAIASGTAIAEAFAISGLALGMGALFPDFRADNAARLAASPAGVAFMVVAVSFSAAVVALEVPAAWLVLRADAAERALRAWEWAAVAGSLAAVAALCAAAALLPVRVGARRLWRRGLG